MTYEPGRVLALDVGQRRIGVAMSDTLRVLASPLTTVPAQPHATALARIGRLVAGNEVTLVVIGLPLTMSGEIGPQAQLVQAFANDLRQHLSQPIHMFDERLTSVEAERMMIEMGLKREQRRTRIDEIAASLILRDFLQTLREKDID